ncbi:sugar-binding transcriptional regulator [Mesorhizobium sp. M0166]|uniref:sugar-binding transcriptional regulator n=1 Tax=unclassified Mesorhizobium TaxID=325217 RepID=UPI0033373391
MEKPARKKRDGRQAVTSSVTADREEGLLVRAAWLAYVGDLTQAQIAKSLGLTRLRVNRMLAHARQRGIVQIRINSKVANCIELEHRLRDAYGVSDPIVVPTPPDPALVPQVIAAAAGEALSHRIRDGISVGVGWGRTLQLSLRSVTVRPVRGMSVVSLLGGLTRGSAINIYEIASRLAALFDAECFYIAAPVFTDTEATRDLLMRQSILEDAFTHARDVDAAFVSVGAVHKDATIFRIGLVGDDDLRSLREAGAVGDICGHWIGADGHLVDHPLNSRVIGLAPEHLRDVDTVILPSGGLDKVPVLRAVLRLGVVDVLITDEKTAEAILAEKP